MKNRFIFLYIISLLFISCSDDVDDSKSDKDTLIGYWALTQIKTIEHIGNTHNTFDTEIPPHSWIYPSNLRADILIFDEEMATVRCDMPNRPKLRDYDENIEGERNYAIDLESWENSIGRYTDEGSFPVGSYSIISKNLYIGTLNMGHLNFTSDNEFTLDYTIPAPNSIDYKRLIYTFTRIYSLYI
ncbi:MAG: hypothetical protein K2H74_08175 [Paramuribaculum sp.]|nr:hypothetical protein [Paramuribaculum sp.]